MTTEEKEPGIRTGRDGANDGRDDGIVGAVETAIRYPTESDDVAMIVVIGGLLSLFSFLVVPIFLLSGYLVRVLDRTADGDDVPPAFEEWGELAITGVKAAVIGFVYALLPAIVGGGVVLLGGVGIGLGGDGPLAGIGVLGVILGGLLWGGLALLVSYLLPAALANFARTESIGAGFDFGTLSTIWTSRPYALAWVTMILVFLIGGLVVGVLNVVPILGTIAGAFVGFYFAVAAYSVIGRAWADFPVAAHDGR
ncbi:DUF4013 domain-containing protein [Halopenitus salinus]|uniref:DUF4013 domain-containing protein n=1 Tax=Halopenitus salinus TaxID=1198295 RepID=A0ABD5USM2_9EURY